jgi:hypothetical protein
MRYHATRPPLRRMKAIDQAPRAGRWPADKSPAAELEADPRIIRRDLECIRQGIMAQATAHRYIVTDNQILSGADAWTRDADREQRRMNDWGCRSKNLYTYPLTGQKSIVVSWSLAWRPA